MIIIACVDNSFGLLFNNRRLSKDRAVTKRILELTKGHNLLTNSFSSDLFEGAITKENEDFLITADKEDFCFIENKLPDNFEEIDKVILFFWNRDYPSDLTFPLPRNFKEVSRNEFKGYSHDKITEVHYEKDI